MKILVVGISGMLGHKIFLELQKNRNLKVFGMLRNIHNYKKAFAENTDGLIDGIHVENIENIDKHIGLIKPNYIINCIGVIKQNNAINKHLEVIKINSSFPHQLAALCTKHNSKLIHFSTDCVFSGNTGMYRESDMEDARDLYGRSKLIGEIDYDSHLTLRTSMIGHELKTKSSLLEWFLDQKGSINGFSKAIFSGLPTITIARVLEKIITNHSNLEGVYHLAADPINKYDLLHLVKKIYSFDIQIKMEKNFLINRSLNSSRFFEDTKIVIPAWENLIKEMHQDYMSTTIYEK